METRVIHLPIDIYKVLERIADENERTVPAQLRVILRENIGPKRKLDKANL